MKSASAIVMESIKKCSENWKIRQLKIQLLSQIKQKANEHLLWEELGSFWKYDLPVTDTLKKSATRKIYVMKY